jgi:thiol-disulfide isomerase/thioredoxin
MLGALGLASALVLAAVFVAAAVAKLTDLAGTRTAVTEFGVPERLAPVVAVAVPLAELVVVGLLIAESTRIAGGAGSLVLLAVFSAAIAVSLARGSAPDCHCFGQLHAAPTSWKTLVRNGLLAVLAALTLAAGIAGETPSAVAWVGDLQPVALVAIGCAIALAALAAVGWLAFLSLTRSYGRVLFRLEATERRLTDAGFELDDDSDRPELGLAPNTPAPEFVVADAAGTDVSLDDLLAPELPLLLLFTSPTCGPCQDLMPKVARWQRDHADRLTIAVANGGDARTSLDEAEKHGLERVLVDHDLALYEAYEASGTPSAVIVSPSKTLSSWVAPGASLIEELMDDALQTTWSREEEGLPVGSPAPEVDLRGLDGEQVSLADPDGSDTLLLFWNPGCGFCREMHEDLLAWEQRPAEDTPRFLIVSAGDEASTRAEGFASTVVLDPEFSLGEPFGAGGTPMALLVDGEGRIGSPLAAGAEAVRVLAGRERPSRQRELATANGDT